MPFYCLTALAAIVVPTRRRLSSLAPAARRSPPPPPLCSTAASRKPSCVDHRIWIVTQSDMSRPPYEIGSRSCREGRRRTGLSTLQVHMSPKIGSRAEVLVPITNLSDGPSVCSVSASPIINKSPVWLWPQSKHVKGHAPIFGALLSGTVKAHCRSCIKGPKRRFAVVKEKIQEPCVPLWQTCSAMSRTPACAHSWCASLLQYPRERNFWLTLTDTRKLVSLA